ncbi:MAG: hypothetical protein O3C21_04205 [Verrucomicrobia bacterium]|nr:hypothetical protein [Verrucomicrobiota bacterium]
MPVLTIVATGLLGALALAAIALIFARAASAPLGSVGESTALSKAESAESEVIFPRWLGTLFLGVYVPLTVGHIVVTSSATVPVGHWTLFLAALVVSTVLTCRCRMIMSRQAKGSKLFRQAQLVLWLSVIGTLVSLFSLAFLPFAVRS